MLERVWEGANCESNGFKKKDWLDIVRGFNQQVICDYGKQQLQSQYSILRQYSVFKRLVDNSGFGWDDEKQAPTAPPEVWDVYIQHHPEGASTVRRP